MKTSEFLNLLKDQASKELIFEYGPGKKIGANYHITEVKNIHVDSVDCGGRADSWNETVVQLWESPAEINKTTYLTTSKAKEIFDRVHAIKPLDLESSLRFEYGNEAFHTAQLYVKYVKAVNGSVTLLLDTQPTLCKANELCGVIDQTEAAEAACCSPGSGCC